MAKKPLELLKPEEIISLMDSSDGRALRAVESARKSIARAARSAAAAIGGGGRLVYVGAGTSGRLGVLDASECGPTFSAKPGQVTGIIAGGRKALYRAVEGAEDDEKDGAAQVAKIKVSGADMVVGITASGTTPFVLGAAAEAARRGAEVWLVTCGKAGDKTLFGSRVVRLDTGPEVIKGSTRLAAGTATKLALNRITTAAFVMMGKVYGELMVDVVPANAKLVKRAVGIIREVTGVDEDIAADYLARAGRNPKAAIVMLMLGLGRRKAERLLEESGGLLRKALDRDDP